MLKTAGRALVLALLGAMSASAYAVLAHEAIIDAAWETSLKPLLLKRFPNSTPEQLLEAHSYAYGGAIIQDMGYYPFGSKIFSDLVHYVRSGDFIVAMVKDAENLDEYAFALGSLSHFAADVEGHSVATNKIVPLLYPKLERKFGNTITYEDNPGAHLKTEFGFDVVQVANGVYAPQAYHDFVGFHVAKPVLERAFEETYDLKMKTIFLSEDLALGSYRKTVGTILPEMTKAAWDEKKADIVKAHPGTTERSFRYNLSRASYEKEWGKQYERPGIGARLLAFFFRLIPKVGPFRALAFHPLTPQTERMFMESFNRALASYKNLLAEVSADQLKLTNDNFDTGKPVVQGQYRMADAAYASLLDKLADGKEPVDPALRQNILAFYQKNSVLKDRKGESFLQSLRSSAATP